MKNITILGTGITKFGELWEQDIRDIGLLALEEALDNAKLLPRQIDALLVSSMNSGLFAGQQHLGTLFTSELGINSPAFHIEAACASGGVAINNAFNLLQTNNYKHIAVLGVEKMNDLPAADVTKGLSTAADEEWESYYGVTFPSLYAMIARAYMQTYQLTRQELALVAVKNHHNGMLNPLAQFQREVSIDQVTNSTIVASPLSILDSSPITDGAAAAILTNTKKKGPKLIASQIATDTLSLHDRESLVELKAVQLASKKALKQSKLTIKDIDIAEVHDCFSIAEILAYEDLGFAQKGKAKELLIKHTTDINGEIPVNTSGGLKACGHPIGATGIKQVVEIARQMQNKAGKRQVKKTLKYGLTHNVGGSGATAVINIIQNA